MFNYLNKIDRRFIYLFVAFSLAIPLTMGLTLKPVELETANSFYLEIEKIKPGKNIVLVSLDWGPNTQAENMPQSEVAIEHLFRKKIPFALISTYALASPFLEEIPKRIAKKLEEENGQKLVYGKDWVNLGFRPGNSIMLQSLAKSEDIKGYLQTDAYGTPVEDLPILKEIKNIKNIDAVIEFTGLSGLLQSWIQFFQGPKLLHGCTSISIPESHIFFSSKQIVGLFEGVAGAAWYDELLEKNFKSREFKTKAININTSLAFAHLVIIFFIFIGNLGLLVERVKK